MSWVQARVTRSWVQARVTVLTWGMRRLPLSFLLQSQLISVMDNGGAPDQNCETHNRKSIKKR